MKNETTFSKCLKVVLSKEIIIIPFDGNLTQNKKEAIATKIQEHFVKVHNAKHSIEKIIGTVFNAFYGRVEKDMKVINRGEKTDLTGNGWGSSNMPSDSIFILN